MVRGDVQVHHEIDDATHSKSGDAIQFDSATDIAHADETQRVVIQRFIGLLVMSDSSAKVFNGLLGLHSDIVRIGQFAFSDIGFNDIGIVANRFKEEDLDIGIPKGVMDHFSAILCGVGRVIDANLTALGKPGFEVFQSRQCRGFAGIHSRWIGGIEKIVSHPSTESFSSVVADIEYPCLVPQPAQISGQLSSGVEVFPRAGRPTITTQMGDSKGRPLLRLMRPSSWPGGWPPNGKMFGSRAPDDVEVFEVGCDGLLFEYGHGWRTQPGMALANPPHSKRVSGLNKLIRLASPRPRASDAEWQISMAHCSP